MDEARIRRILDDVAAARLTPAAAAEALAVLPVAPLADASLDTHRALRVGFPEVVLAQGKTEAQLIDVVGRLAEAHANLLITRVSPAQGHALTAALPGVPLQPHPPSSAWTIEREAPRSPGMGGAVVVISAGTSDAPAAVEAAVTARAMGAEVALLQDLGVAGLHRILGALDALRAARAIVVAAGMEAALPSVVAGLVRAPVIGLPTSTGYGAAQGGLTAMHAMLTACAAGVTVVNVDNGFGAGYAAALIAGGGQA